MQKNLLVQSIHMDCSIGCIVERTATISAWEGCNIVHSETLEETYVFVASIEKGKTIIWARTLELK